MNQTLTQSFALLLAGSAGSLLGLLFFGGLWWTLRRAFASPRPALWVGGSLLLRMACVVGGFIAVSGGDWRRLLACLLGFWMARWTVVRLTTRKPAQASSGAPVAGHSVAGQSVAVHHGGGQATTGSS